MTKPEPNGQVLRVRGLTRVYTVGRTEVPALQGVDLDVGRGEMVAITGASRSGKSTLLHLLGCLDRPTSGTYELDGIRVDTHVEAGYVVPPFYDSLLAKLIVRGRDRGDAIAKMLGALEAFVVEGVPTTIPMHSAILKSDAFRSGRYDTRAIPGWP